MKKELRFQLMTPERRTVFIGKKIKQRAEYLRLPDAVFEKDALAKDIAAGARIYEEFGAVLRHKSSRYNLISAANLEDGLRAVAYLAGIHVMEDDCYEADDGDGKCDLGKELSEGYSDDLDDPLIEVDMGDLFGEEDPEDDLDFGDDFMTEDDDGAYQESVRKIPLIPMQSLMNFSREYDEPFCSDIGAFSLQVNYHPNKCVPWWTGCEKEAVCILVTEDSFMARYSDFSMALTDDQIECLKRFRDNRRVYVLIAKEFVGEQDVSIQKAMFEFTANYFCVDRDKKVRMPYYQKMLEISAAEHGFRFAPSIDVPLLTEKLGQMNRHYPCEKFDKVMDYFCHVGAREVLRPQDFKALGLKNMVSLADEKENTENLERQLAGMAGVKRQVDEIIQMLKFQKIREKRGILGERFHNTHVFLGAPGTAKTTVANYLAKELRRQGLLRSDRFISLSGAQLKGEYVGHTAPKVHAIFQQYDAIFIDEAYSLCDADGGKADSYSQEALAQLAIELEEHSGDKLVIFAGYGGKGVEAKDNKMLAFLRENPGINSRIGSTIYFDSYSATEMLDIVRKLAERSSLKLPAKLEGVKEYFDMRSRARDFGNGREARVLIEQCQRKLAQRVSKKVNPSARDLETVTEKDLATVLWELKNSMEQREGRVASRVGLV